MSAVILLLIAMLLAGGFLRNLAQGCLTLTLLILFALFVVILTKG